jgi:hypothetical protein
MTAYEQDSEDARAGMAGDGALGWFGVVEALEVLGLCRRTGKLHVVTKTDVYGIFLDRGRIILATSTNQALRLGIVLLRRGVVEPARLQTALAAPRTATRTVALGRQLIQEGALTPADLAVGIEEQVIEVVSRVLDADEATIVFANDEPLPPGIEIIPLDTERLIAAARRRSEERTGLRVMDRLLPPSHVRLSLAVQLALVSVHLTDAELLVALAVDRGTATLDGLAAVVPLDRLTLRRTVIGLLERGYLVTRAPQRRFDWPVE